MIFNFVFGSNCGGGEGGDDFGTRKDQLKEHLKYVPLEFMKLQWSGKHKLSLCFRFGNTLRIDFCPTIRTLMIFTCPRSATLSARLSPTSIL